MHDAEFDRRLITAALALAGERGWDRVSVAEAARRADLSLAQARGRFPARVAVLFRLGRLADQGALADPPREGTVRDRLFYLLMQRIDVLQTHRPGVLAVLRALPAHPDLALLLACATRRSMRWMLEAAGVRTRGLRGELRLKGLCGVWLWAMRAWQADETSDMSNTMAALDTALHRAERFAGWLGGRSAGAVPPATEEMPPEESHGESHGEPPSPESPPPPEPPTAPLSPEPLA